MSKLFRLPRTSFLAVGLVLLTSVALLHLRVGATAESGRILFLRLTHKHWQLWMMDGDGRSPRQLTFSPVDKHSPSWCPGNDVVHFSTARGDSVLLELDTGEEHLQLPFVIGVEPPKDLKGDPLPFDVTGQFLLCSTMRRACSFVRLVIIEPHSARTEHGGRGIPKGSPREPLRRREHVIPRRGFFRVSFLILSMSVNTVAEARTFHLGAVYGGAVR